MYLTPTDIQAIEASVTALERAQGVPMVTMVVGKSDVYPETVWKAFSLGSALTALAVTVGDVVRPDWVTAGAVFTAVIAILFVGAACAVATVYVPAVTRLFLRESRAALEVHQCAQVQFLQRELFATGERTAILMLVSLLERRVVILADSGLQPHVSVAEWDAVIARMSGDLRAGQVGAAMLAGLAAIGELLAGKPIARGAGNAFSDQPIEEPGA